MKSIYNFSLIGLHSTCSGGESNSYMANCVKQIHICDRAREKGPSGHIKFDHIFQLC